LPQAGLWYRVMRSIVFLYDYFRSICRVRSNQDRWCAGFDGDGGSGYNSAVANLTAMESL
jgi:hypothetical protein